MMSRARSAFHRPGALALLTTALFLTAPAAADPAPSVPLPDPKPAEQHLQTAAGFPVPLPVERPGSGLHAVTTHYFTGEGEPVWQPVIAGAPAAPAIPLPGRPPVSFGAVPERLGSVRIGSVLFRVPLPAPRPLEAAFVIPAVPQAPAPGRVSAGCGVPPPADPVDSVTASGETQGLITVIPADYRPSQAYRLVIGFHGRTQSNAQVRRYYDLEQHATLPTIFAYPAGFAHAGGPTWSSAASGVQDFGLFDAIVATLGRSYCLDLDRVFAVGHSLGGSYVNGLACARGDRLRGIATMGGGGWGLANCRGRTAAMIMHNPHDRAVDVALGEQVRDVLVAQNGFAAAAVATAPQRFACERFGPADGRDPILWCPHRIDRTSRGRYYPHGWPNGTGAAMMAFFEHLP